MQEQGMVPTVVENAIQSGQKTTGKIPGTTAYYDSVNDLTVITDTASGRVVTAKYGYIKQ
jgi:filamentous hemagglutinin